MATGAPLVARLHIDLKRVASATCPRWLHLPARSAPAAPRRPAAAACWGPHPV